jgi:(S)-citramalyl-CoA lyase
VLGERTPGIVPLIETVRGLNGAQEIASAPGVVAMMFGGGDFAAELGVQLAWEPLLAARGALVLACAGAGIPAIDVPFVGLEDVEGLLAETRAAKALGFSAKAAIHPAQVEPINSVLRPTPEEIAEAEEAARVFAAAGGAAVRFRGRMLEAPIMRRYQRILTMRSKSDA